MRVEMTLHSPEQLGALAHPLRQRILGALMGEPRTNKQIASMLNEAPGRLHFHVRELERAGLIELVEQRPKGGVLEKYYRAAAYGFRLGPLLAAMGPGGQGVASAALDAAREELVRAAQHFGAPLVDTRVAHERARLSDQALARVHAHLDAIIEELRRATDGAEEGDGDHPIVLTYLLHPAPKEAGD